MQVKIGQNYRHKDEPTTSVKLRVVSIDGQMVEMERCEHHEGLAHETFNVSMDYLLQNYDLVAVDILSTNKRDIPINPKTGKPYFEVPDDAWGGEWKAQEVQSIPDNNFGGDDE